MREKITISLPKSIKKRLDSETQKEHLNRSEIVCKALRKYFAKNEFQKLRKIMIPQAEKAGILSDNDIFELD